MSFSNILSSNTVEPPTKPSPAPATSPVQDFRIASKTPNSDLSSARKKSPPGAVMRRQSHKVSPPKEITSRKQSPREPPKSRATKASAIKKHGTSSDKENDKVAQALTEIDAQELSDIDIPEFEQAKADYQSATVKRAASIEMGEESRRKVSLLDEISGG